MMIDAETVEYCLKIKEIYNAIENEPFLDQRTLMRIKCDFINLHLKTSSLTAEEISELLNLPPFIVCEIEKRQFPMSRSNFLKLARVLGKARESLLFVRKVDEKKKIKKGDEKLSIHQLFFI